MLLEQQQADFTNKLALHQSRQCQSIPTVSTLVGGTAATRSLWTRWVKKEGKATAICLYQSPLSLLEAWLTVIAERHNLHALAIARVAHLANRDAEGLSAWLTRAGDYQTRQFWERLAEAHQVSWLKVLVKMKADRCEFLSEMLSHESIDLGTNNLGTNDFSTLKQGIELIASLLPDRDVTGLLIQLSDDCQELSSYQSILSVVTQLAEAVPAVPLGLLLSPAQAEKVLSSELPESRMKAALRGGMVKLSMPEEKDLRQWLGDRGLVQEKKLTSIIHAAQTYGATEEMLSAALSLSEPDEPSDFAGDDTFRSHSEWLLFQYLEARPSTAGQFQPNAQLDIRFGNRAMEADFLAAKAKIVIELDGYYHFQSSDSYRRDRRKDVALQQAGFWVLRFLSEDVVANLEEILATIDQALATRLAYLPVASEA